MQFIKMIIRLTMMSTLLIIVQSCSTTTVHLNKLFLSQESAEAMKVELENQGYEVEFNELIYPKNITSTSILYSPLISDSDAIENIETSLTRLGYKVSNVNDLVASNHWYLKDTVGLYIVPNGIVPNSGKNIEDIAFEYQAEYCKIGAEETLGFELTLVLNKDSTFTFISDKKPSNPITGKLTITEYPYILLESKTPYIYSYYQIIRRTKTDKISEIDVIDLQPLSDSAVIENCVFSYGERK